MTDVPTRRELSRRVEKLTDDLESGEPLEIVIRNRNVDGELFDETRIRYGASGEIISEETIDGPAEPDLPNGGRCRTMTTDTEAAGR